MGWWSSIVNTVEDVVGVVAKPLEWAIDAISWFAEASINIVSGVGSFFGGLMPDMPSSPTYSKDSPTNTIEEGLEIPRAYGRVRLGGNVLRVNTPDSDAYVKMLVAHCEGPIDQILAWYINNKDITTLQKQNSMYYAYASGTTTQGILQVNGADLFTEKPCAFRGLAYSGLKLDKTSDDIGGSFPSTNVVARCLLCTPIAKNLTSTTYAWTKSGSGVSEYYCRLADSSNPGVSSPQTLYIKDISKTTAILGSLTTGTWNYGDNDALGYSVPYVCLTQGDSDYADPDVSALTHTVKVEEEKTFSRNPAVIMWDWYRHVENYSVGELDDLSWKSLEVVCNQTPIGEGGPIRPPGPSRDTVKETSHYGQSNSNNAYNFYGCYAFDINKSIDGTHTRNQWESRNMAAIPLIGDWLGLIGGPGRQRLNVDLGVEGILTKIVLVNGHINGAETDRGIKTFSMQCSNTASDLNIVGYLGTGSSWVSIPQIILPSQYSATTPEVSYAIGGVSQTTIPYRYYSLKIQDNHGDPLVMDLRDCCFWIKSKRYLFDYIYDNEVEINDAKKLIWASFNGNIIRSQGKLKPVFRWHQEADGKGNVTDKTRRHTFTEANIIKDSFAWSIPERVNSVTVEYLDPNENFKKTSIKIRDDDDIATRGEVVYKETCYFITAQDVARRRAQQRLNEAMYVRKRCSLKGMDDASDLEVYDMSGVSHILAPWTGTKDFLILSKRENVIGECEFEMEEYYPGIYNDQQAPVPESYYAVTGLLKEEPKAVRDLALTNSSYWDDKGAYNFYADVSYLLPMDNLNISYVRYQYSLLESGGTVRTAGSGASLNLSMDTATYASATTDMIIMLTTGVTPVSRIITSLDAGASNQVTINGEIDGWNGGSGYSFKYLKFVDYSKGIDHSRGSTFKFNATVAEVESGDTLYVRAIPVNYQGVSANQNNCSSAMCEFKIDFNTEIAAITKDCKRIFPKGVYELTSAVTIPDYNITIAGVNRDAVVIQNYPASHALVLYNSTTKQITFQDFTISSQNSIALANYSNLINIYSASTVGNRADVVIDNLKINCIQDNTPAGTNLDRSISAIAHNKIEIKNSELEKGRLYLLEYNKAIIRNNKLNDIQHRPIYCGGVTSLIVRDNTISNFMWFGMDINSCGSDASIINNKITCRNDVSIHSSIIGIQAYEINTLKILGNEIYLNNVSGNSSATGMRIQNSNPQNRQEISNNTVNIDFLSNKLIYGLYLFYSDNSTFCNNTINISNPDTYNNHYGIQLSIVNQSSINNNVINMTNSTTRDVGIYIESDSDNNTLLNNAIQNTGTTPIWNLGSNNNIGTNTEVGLNIAVEDGRHSKTFMGSN